MADKKTLDAAAILKDVDSAIADLEHPDVIQTLTPQLGFALSGLRGVQGAIAGHLKRESDAVTAEAAAKAGPLKA